MSDTLFDVLGNELSVFLAPAISAAEDPYWLALLLTQLGSTGSDSLGHALGDALRAVTDVVTEIEALAANPSPSFADIGQLLESARKALAAIRSLDDPHASPDLAGMGKDLIDLLAGMYVSSRAPLLYRILVLLCLVDSAEEIIPTQPVVVGGQTVRGPVSLPRLHPDRLGALFQDPVAFLRSQYLFNELATDADANAIADKIFPRIRGLLRVLEVLCRYGIPPEQSPLFGDGAPLAEHMLTVWIEEELLGATEDVGLAFAISPASRGDLGLVIAPFGTIQYKNQTGSWTFGVDFSAEVEALGIGRRGTVIAASVQTASLEGNLSASLVAPESGPAFILGTATGTRLEVGGAAFVAKFVVANGTFDLALSGDISSSSIVVVPGDGDGFLASVLPAEGLTVKFDLGLGWSSTGGLTFRGAGGLDSALPVGINIGGVFKIPVIYLRLHASNAAVEAEVSASVSLSIGPVQAVIDRVGLLVDVTFPDSGGNLGPMEASFGFKPPSGVGLVVDSAGVSGGGFLAYNSDKHEFTGVLQLEFSNLELQGFGLITTQVAGGHGYSLLALIDANFPPVQLGWGFTLNGVGGLLAVNRTASVDALRAGLKADKLSTILFPKNAITNAPQILAQLETLFPAASGRFLFGPMALIGWGTPTVLTAALAVIIELPEPIRIILLARIAARLPSESNPLIRVNLDALGVLDLSQGTLSLDATLFDSHLLNFTISGDMALRANWSSSPREFLLAIGGFHPHFSPPAGFPTLQRVTIDMPSGPISKLRLAAYIALTSNTLQFGATLDVFIGVSSFGLSGHLGFDALLQKDPLHFDADISGQVALTAGGDDLMSVKLNGTLSGPGPWHIAGDFTVHIVFFDVSKSFSHTWGDDAPALPIAPVDVMPLLTAALADARNWGATLPPEAPALVSLKKSSGAIVHPLGQLEVHESVAPLGLAITRYGSAPVAGAASFTITSLQVNGSTPGQETIQDDFAPAQFFELSDDEKLARPSFERQDAGIRLTGTMVSCGAPVSKAISYETFYVDQPGGPLRSDPVPKPGPFVLGELSQVLALGSSGRAAIGTAGDRRYTAPGNPVRVAQQSFVIADRTTLNLAGIGAVQGSTYSNAQAALKAALAADPARRASLQIVATHEIGAV